MDYIISPGLIEATRSFAELGRAFSKAGRKMSRAFVRFGHKMRKYRTPRHHKPWLNRERAKRRQSAHLWRG